MGRMILLMCCVSVALALCVLLLNWRADYIEAQKPDCEQVQKDPVVKICNEPEYRKWKN